MIKNEISYVYNYNKQINIYNIYNIYKEINMI